MSGADSDYPVGDKSRHDFRTLSSREIYRGNVFALRSDEVAMPGGATARREVVEHFGAVAVAALDEHDRLVLIHQYRHPLGRRIWELPAGLLDMPDESAVETAARELAEEAGLVAAEWSVLVDVAASPGMTDEVVRIFLVRGLSTVDRVVPGDDEEADLVIRRFSMVDAVRMVFAGEIINNAAVSGVLATHTVLTGAVVPRPADALWSDRPHRFTERRSASFT